MKNIELGKSTLFFVLCFIINNLVFAQSIPPKIKFTENNYDFGRIKEADGEVKHTFFVENISEDTLFLQSVRASCGCTTPFWEKEGVLPGDSAKIVVAYNPFNRPGKFNKTITVKSSLPPTAKLLRISGYVEPKSVSIEDNYPTEMGGIRFKSKFLNFGTITTEKPVTKTFEIFNQSSDTITFSDKVVSGDFISVNVEPKVLYPKRGGAIKITYKPEVKNDLGFHNDQLVIFTDEENEPNKNLNLIATILEYFPPMSEKELAKQPKINFEEEEFDFESVQEGDSIVHAFVFENTGKKTLNIRQVKSSCDCLSTSIDKEDIKSGESALLKVAFDTKGRRGPQVKRVTLFTNDPTAPAKDIIIKAYVKE